ncbi:add [Scenedesmus sp. PABB004]|nr:add [Scenedesmus sp. PABB004]
MPGKSELHYHYDGGVPTEDLIDAAVRADLALCPATATVAARANADPAACAGGGWTPIGRFASEHGGAALSSLLLEGWSTYNYEGGARGWSNYNYVQTPREAPAAHFFSAFARFAAAKARRPRAAPRPRPQRRTRDAARAAAARAAAAARPRRAQDVDPRAMLRATRARAVDEGTVYMEVILLMLRGPALSAAFEARLRGAARARDAAAALAALDEAFASVPRAAWDGAATAYARSVEALGAGLDGPNFAMRFVGWALRLLPPLDVFSAAAVGFLAAGRSPLLVGVNLVGPEADPVALRDYWLHMVMFKYLRSKFPAVRVALHAGELELDLVALQHLTSHVADAVRIGGAHRVGHGVALPYEPDQAATLEYMRDNGIALEVLLTSNEFVLPQTAGRHPFVSYLRAGVPLVISSDDPGILRTSLTEQYVTMALHYPAVTYADLRRMTLNGLRFSFLREPQLKRRLLGRAEADLARFEADALAGKVVHASIASRPRLVCRLLCVSRGLAAGVARHCAGRVPLDASTWRKRYDVDGLDVSAWLAEHGRLLETLDVRALPTAEMLDEYDDDDDLMASSLISAAEAAPAPADGAPPGVLLLRSLASRWLISHPRQSQLALLGRLEPSRLAELTLDLCGTDETARRQKAIARAAAAALAKLTALARLQLLVGGCPTTPVFAALAGLTRLRSLLAVFEPAGLPGLAKLPAHLEELTLGVPRRDAVPKLQLGHLTALTRLCAADADAVRWLRDLCPGLDAMFQMPLESFMISEDLPDLTAGSLEVFRGDVLPPHLKELQLEGYGSCVAVEPLLALRGELAAVSLRLLSPASQQLADLRRLSELAPAVVDIALAWDGRCDENEDGVPYERECYDRSGAAGDFAPKWSALAGVRELSFVGQDLFGERGEHNPLDFLPRVASSLTRLCIDDQRGMELFATELAALSELRELELSGCWDYLELEGAAVVAALPQLRKLAVRYAQKILDHLPHVVRDLSRLTSLSLDSIDGMHDAHVELLAGALHGLRELRLSARFGARASVDITDACLPAVVAGCPQLTSLDLSRTKVTDTGVRQLTALTALRVLDVAHAGVSQATVHEVLQVACEMDEPTAAAAVRDSGASAAPADDEPMQTDDVVPTDGVERKQAGEQGEDDEEDDDEDLCAVGGDPLGVGPTWGLADDPTSGLGGLGRALAAPLAGAGGGGPALGGGQAPGGAGAAGGAGEADEEEYPDGDVLDAGAIGEGEFVAQPFTRSSRRSGAVGPAGPDPRARPDPDPGGAHGGSRHGVGAGDLAMGGVAVQDAVALVGAGAHGGGARPELQPLGVGGLRPSREVAAGSAAQPGSAADAAHLAAMGFGGR